MLSEAAAGFREQGRHFSAGCVMQQAIHAAWGSVERIRSCVQMSARDYEECLRAERPDSLESLAALFKYSTLLGQATWTSDADKGALKIRWESLWLELAQQLTIHFTHSSHANNYLVRGVLITTDLDGTWQSEYPEYEIDSQSEQFGDGFITIGLPSAFQLFVRTGDYQGAQTVAQACPDAFGTLGLRGWRAAVQGFTTPAEAPEKFAEAADAFAEDRDPGEEGLALRGGSWTSINVDLWARYFQSRSALAMAVRRPEQVTEFITKASEAVQGTEDGWQAPSVLRYRILVQSLTHLVGEEPGLALEEAKQQLSNIQIADANDTVVMRFLELASEAFLGFSVDPAKEVTTGRLPMALEMLGRIPLIGPDVASAVGPKVGAQAIKEVLGPLQTWIHRTLEAIQEERTLQLVLLRLLQGYLPLYAQILHGPLEYGKDIAVLLEENGERVLRMYQVKCGNITTTVWRNARQELEEMFLVPLSELQLHGPVERREGVLVCNGHAQPYVLPTIEGWISQQKEAFDRDIDFMHLDDIVQWISTGRLVNEFKSVLSELGLDPL